MANESAGTGVVELDRALDGLYWGDNVVWVWEGSETHQQLFYDAIAQRRDDFGAAAYVAVSSDPAEITARWPWIEILDARAGTPITSPRQLLEAIRQFCTRAPRPLLLFDSLAPMADRWGMRIASGFFGHCCPMLLDLGAIAYWSIPGASPYRTMHREMTSARSPTGRCRGRARTGPCTARSSRSPSASSSSARAACASARLRGARREPRASCSATPSRTGSCNCSRPQAAARVGAALRAYRLRRDLSQSDLARLAGVSPSAISQVERGERGLSLETLMTLSGRLNVTLDELLGGEVTPDYRIGRRHGLGAAPAGSILPLLDDAEAGMRAYLVSLPRSATVEAPFAHKGAELVGVVSGLIQVLLSSGRPVLRRGETLLASRRGIDGWRNMGEGDAQCLWVLRD